MIGQPNPSASSVPLIQHPDHSGDQMHVAHVLRQNNPVALRPITCLQCLQALIRLLHNGTYLLLNNQICNAVQPGSITVYDHQLGT